MKKLFLLFLLSLVLIAVSAPVMAGGDQVQGDKATGDAFQFCVTPDMQTVACPFGDPTF